MKYFTFSTFFMVAGVLLAYLFLGGVEAAYVVVILALLEVSISFDNAIVNAKVLQTMDAVWRDRFIIYGIPVAVFGVRFLLPILIVSLASGIGFFDIVNMAVNDPKAYKEELEHVMGIIYAFGGAFLLMVFLEFYFDHNREVKWLAVIEHNPITRGFGKIESIELILAIGLGLVVTSLTEDYTIAFAYFCGILLHALLNSLDDVMSSGEGVRSGIMGFLYLEVLDASFSLDGVIGAFAISNDIFIIMIGLSIGAFYVRSMTIYFVEKNTLSEFRYLEHGAHYAILVLAVIMFIKIFVEVGEALTGTLGIAIIIAAIIHSVVVSKKEKKEALEGA